MRDFTVPGFGIRSPFGGRRWHPRALFASGAPGALYLPSPATCFQDAAGTTPAGDGDPVGYVADLSGNGNPATQPTSAQRPTLWQDAGGTWHLDFDGVDDWMDTGVTAVAGKADRFAAVAGDFIPTTRPYNHLLHSGSQATGGSWGLVTRVAGVDGLGNHYWGSGYNSGIAITGADVFSVNLAGEVETYRSARTDTAVDHALPAEVSTGTTYGFKLMSRISSPAEFGKGKLFGAVILGRAVTATERARLETYLANISGVTL